MATWRDFILQHFTAPTQQLTLAADPDGLLLEEELLVALRARGFALLPFDDPIAFRYAYESDYRQYWDRELPTDLVVILRSPLTSLQSLPYDLLQVGRRLHFSLTELFPHLSYPIVSQLDPSHFQPLYQACQAYPGPALGDRATGLFILKHVFSLDPALIKTPLDLLKHLLSRHVGGRRLPSVLDRFVFEALHQQPPLNSWPLESLLDSAETFFDFLQGGWSHFLAAQQQSSDTLKESSAIYQLDTPLPFAEPEVRVYLDNLFLEDKLQPITVPETWQIESWALVGIEQPTETEIVRRFDHLSRRVAEALPGEASSYKDWLSLAELWAELIGLRYDEPQALSQSQLDAIDRLHPELETQFARWLMARYHTLHNQPYLPRPVMVHQIAEFLAAYRATHRSERLALLVIDGLAFDQWQIIRQAWTLAQYGWQIDESALFAWIPTLTAISRQTIFAGRSPRYFPGSWQTTHQEAAQWRQFWLDRGMVSSGIGYIRNLGTTFSAPLETQVLTAIEDKRVQVLGLVVNIVDNVGHGMQLGTAGMRQQIRLWISQQDYLTELTRTLLTEGFSVFLTADHGNIWAHGIGRPDEGVLAEQRGQRARIYTDSTFLTAAQRQIPEAVAWTNVGLPAEMQVLLAPELSAFLDSNAQAICHGGISLEEVIVPFVKIKSATAGSGD